MKRLQKGNLIVIVVILIAGIAVFGVSVLKLFTRTTMSDTQYLMASQSYYLAKAGLDYGILAVKNQTNMTAISSLCSGGPYTKSYGDGEFQFSCTVYNNSSPVTTLSSNITSGDMTIPVASATDMPALGTVVIGNEAIEYSGKTTDSLIVRNRGLVPASHNSPADVYYLNNQVLVTATGGVPSVSGASANATMAATLQVQVPGDYLWAVGSDASSQSAIYQWNTGTSTWDPMTLTAPLGSPLNDVSCTSVYNCWAVGDSGTLYHWNGDAWSRDTEFTTDSLKKINCVSDGSCQALSNPDTDGNSSVFEATDGITWNSTPVQTITANNLDCPADDMCIAVGNGGNIYEWHGSSWSSMSSPLSADLNAVSCPTTDECYAVGDINTSTDPNTLLKYNGSTWSNFTDVGFGKKEKDLIDISCPSTNFCWAVSANKLYTTQYDGSSWAREKLTGQQPQTIVGISCLTSQECFLYGQKGGGDMLLQHWLNGTWTTQVENDMTLNGFTEAVETDTSVNFIGWKQQFN